MQIVVADDDAIQRSFTSAVLARLGHSAIEAADGDTALRLVIETNAPILICDLNMPGLDGHQLTRRVRAQSFDHYVHIIMVTGRDQSAERAAALDAGIDDFMSKPLDAAMLTVRIRAAARLIQHEEALAERNRILEVAKERIERDLHDAAAAQRRLLPDLRGRIQGCSFASAFVPSTYVSGDMFSCFELGPDMLGFYAVDVAGHGVHAALLSVAIGHLVTAEYFMTHAFDPEGRADPAAMVRGLNTRFFSDEATDYFTMFCGVIARSSDQLVYCQAGYPSPYVIAPTGSLRVVGDGGFPVGLLLEAEFETRLSSFAPGETMVLCSDGASEAESPQHQPFGEERLGQLVADAAPAGLAAIPQAVVSALARWREGIALEDDLTVLALERSRFS
ncbi:PP2C family protein-serine/threonine phosphatase [Phaeovulum sp. W22_SRMD_FR3]|uniref:PP2C family protein-serine/threonine phosphatase n=1 Tax=Phaeovulum sp. W22_SRMD_FR3 TaxID=3240274 RepID=UPI003F96A032